MFKLKDRLWAFHKRSWLTEPDFIELISVWLNVLNGQYHFKTPRKLLMRLM